MWNSKFAHLWTAKRDQIYILWRAFQIFKWNSPVSMALVFVTATNTLVLIATCDLNNIPGIATLYPFRMKIYAHDRKIITLHTASLRWPYRFSYWVDIHLVGSFTNLQIAFVEFSSAPAETKINVKMLQLLPGGQKCHVHLKKAWKWPSWHCSAPLPTYQTPWKSTDWWQWWG